MQLTETIPPEWSELVNSAREAMLRAYAPYSRFRVGAAVMAGSGRIYSGFNIENAAYPAAMCAERVAVYAALASGETSLERLALVGEVPEALSPCGMCRQVLAEVAPGIVTALATPDDRVRVVALADLLPMPFAGSMLAGRR